MKSATPITDALCSDPEISRANVHPRVWREMAKLEADRAQLVEALRALRLVANQMANADECVEADNLLRSLNEEV